MFKALAFLAFVAVGLCATPPRPNIPEDFYAEVNSEYHLNDGRVLFGEGRWAVDSTQNLGVEDYKFEDNRHREFYVFNLERYDLGYQYTINSFNRSYCNESAVQGNMPATWGWLPYANYTGPKEFHHQHYDTWSYSFAGFTLMVGVYAPNYNEPAIFSQIGGGVEVFINFNRFQASTDFNHSIFDVPPQCPQSELIEELSAPPTPKRPNPSEVFEAQTRVEFWQNGTNVYADGYLASDQPNNKYVEQFDTQQPHERQPSRFFELRRYDLGEIYYINSQNYTDCNKRAVNGSEPPFWAWIAQANYVGQHYVHSLGLLDIWNYVAGGVNVTLGVNDRDVNVPQFLARETSNFAVRYDFVRWSTQSPNPSNFEVPPECQ